MSNFGDEYKFDIQVDQTVYLVPWGNIARRLRGADDKHACEPARVSKIARKYFYVELIDRPNRDPIKFDRETFVAKLDDCNSGYFIYDSVASYDSQLAANREIDEIKKFLDRVRYRNGIRKSLESVIHEMYAVMQRSEGLESTSESEVV